MMFRAILMITMMMPHIGFNLHNSLYTHSHENDNTFNLMKPQKNKLTVRGADLLQAKKGLVPSSIDFNLIPAANQEGR